MTTLITALLIAIGLLLLWRVVALMGKYRPTVEPAAPADGDTGVREPVLKRPPVLSGAVALEEPDEE